MGIARNVSETIEAEVERLDQAFSFVKCRKFFIVESDSDDDTLEKLESLKEKLNHFDFKSLGVVAKIYPVLWDRLAYVRNFYLQVFLNSEKFADCDYLVVSDLDGTNELLTYENALSPFSRNDWAACFCNQNGHYYDVLALRHPKFAPDDCFLYERRLVAQGVNPVTAKRMAILSRQRRIPAKTSWISVDSAFGGLAVYRRSFLANARYSSRTHEGQIICEHISFHRQIKDNGGELYIVPSFINHGEGEHTAHFKLKFRVRRFVKFFLYELGFLK